MSTDSQKVIYWLDRKRNIIEVGGAWDRFALENDASKAFSRQVQGNSVWKYIRDDSTRMWLDTLLQLAEITGDAVERPYRCDSPDTRRYMQMKIIPEKPGVLRVEHRVVSTEKRNRTVYFKTSDQMSRNMVSRCSICGRVKSKDQWQEPDQGTQEKPLNLTVVYTVCPTCSSSLSSRKSLEHLHHKS